MRDKKKRKLQALTREPFIWIGIWIFIPLILYVLLISIGVLNLHYGILEKYPILGDLLTNLAESYLFFTPIVLPLLCIWAFIKGIIIIKNKKIAKGVIYIIFSLIIILLVVLYYWILIRGIFS